MEYLSVTNLTKFQHYKHRNPPWIKLYREFWTDYTLRSLSVNARLLFIGLTSLAMELENKIPNDERYLSDRLGFKIVEKDIYNLISSNLILSNLHVQVASNPLAECLQDASIDTNTLINGRDYQSEAREILEFLNLKTGKQYRMGEINLGFIEARLKSGVDVQTCKSLIARKVRDWTPKPEMVGYLRPETLFNKTKFETYLAEVSQ